MNKTAATGKTIFIIRYKSHSHTNPLKDQHFIETMIAIRCRAGRQTAIKKGKRSVKGVMENKGRVMGKPVDGGMGKGQRSKLKENIKFKKMTECFLKGN